MHKLMEAKQEVRLGFVGGSITEGTGSDRREDSWPGRLTAMLQVRGDGLSVQGLGRDSAIANTAEA